MKRKGNSVLLVSFIVLALIAIPVVFFTQIIFYKWVEIFLFVIIFIFFLVDHYYPIITNNQQVLAQRARDNEAVKFFKQKPEFKKLRIFGLVIILVGIPILCWGLITLKYMNQIIYGSIAVAFIYFGYYARMLRKYKETKELGEKMQTLQAESARRTAAFVPIAIIIGIIISILMVVYIFTR